MHIWYRCIHPAAARTIW